MIDCLEKNNINKFIKTIKDKYCFFSFYCIYFFTIMIDTSVYVTKYPFVDNIMSIIRYICYIFFLIRFILCFFSYKEKIFNINIKNIILYILLLFIFSIVMNTILTRNTLIPTLLIVMMAAIDISFDEMLNITYKMQLITMCFITASCAFNLIGNFETFRADGSIRNSIGYDYPTNFSTYLLALTLMYMFIKRFIVENYTLFVIQLLYIISFFLTKSRTQFLIGEIVFIFGVLYKYHIIHKFKSFLLKVLKTSIYIFPLLPITSLMVSMFSKNHFIMKLNTLLNGRIELTKLAIDKYGISLFGKTVDFIGGGLSDLDKLKAHTYLYVDNGYMQAILKHGILVVLCLIVLIFISLMYMYSKKQYLTVSLCLIFLYGSLINPWLINFKVSPLLFIIFPTIISAMKENNRKYI